MGITQTRTKTFTGTSLVKPLVKSILENPGDREWSLQGFGMLRTYIAPELRLHIWDSRYKVPGVTTMHTHPWNFHSFIVAGKVHNTRYEKASEAFAGALGKKFREQQIVCGEGGHEIDVSEIVTLVCGQRETYREGDEYSQFANEIHFSDPLDGTVTLIQREFLEDTERAFVYVPDGLEWVSAEPRPATDEEVASIINASLGAWFS